MIPQLKPLIEEEVGKTMALSTVYRMLARHGWRKLAPDTYHPQGDAKRREVWKKLPEAIEGALVTFSAPCVLRWM